MRKGSLDIPPPEYTADEWKQIDAEFQRLKDEHYLDHAGAGLYAESQIREVSEALTKTFFCNPHTSKLTEDVIDQVRYRILRHFNTDTHHYEVIFTSNATAALKLLAETFDFNYHKQPRENADIKIPGSFVYTIDNHVSVLGMREVVQTNLIRCIERDELLANAEKSLNPLFVTRNSSLIVFPAESNFCGFKYPLELIERIQTDGLKEKDRVEDATDWYVALDAACLAATSPVDLARHPADYVCVSFYKMFGYPTGLGCLLVSKRGAKPLKKKYYGGGTIKVALGTKNWHQKRDNSIHERFEDGTIPYLSITSLLTGFKTLERLVPPCAGYSTFERISQHTFQIAKYFYTTAKSMKHSTGQNVVEFFNATGFESPKTQGGIVAFLLRNPDGSYVGYAEFNCIASLYKIHVRTGCFCNPGACQRYLNMTDDEVVSNYEAGHICGDTLDMVNGLPTGAVRISFGYSTKPQDIDVLISMIRTCFVDKRKTERNHHKLTLMTPQVKVQDVNGNLHVPIRLRQICIYPVKSCGPIKIDTKWPLNSRGLKFDREWLVVRENGVAMTQKQEPRLCLIRPRLTETHLTLTFPDIEPVSIPLETLENGTQTQGVSLCQSKVCNDNVDGDDCGSEVAEWLSNVLNTDGLRLLRQNHKRKRFAKEKEVALSNQAQFLVINRTSIKWLAEQVDAWHEDDFDDEHNEKVENVVDRFRGNLIVEMDNHLEENQLTALVHNGVRLEKDGLCTRCQMICIDQGTGEKTSEPLRTLTRVLGGKMRFGVYFSQNSIGGYLDCTKSITGFLE